MLEVMLGGRIPLERTRFIDEPGLVELIRRGKVIELLALMEDGLINAVTELSSYGKVPLLSLKAALDLAIDLFPQYLERAGVPIHEDLDPSEGPNGEEGSR